MLRIHRNLRVGLSTLCCLTFVTCITALPRLLLNSTLTPIGDGENVILDVGQHVRVTSENWGLGIVLTVFGLVEVFYGFKLIRITLIFTGFLSWGKIGLVDRWSIKPDAICTPGC